MTLMARISGSSRKERKYGDQEREQIGVHSQRIGQERQPQPPTDQCSVIQEWWRGGDYRRAVLSGVAKDGVEEERVPLDAGRRGGAVGQDAQGENHGP